MSLNSNPDSRLYHLLSQHRFEEAVVLFENRKTNGCSYLAGFAVECILKSLILANSTPNERPKLRLRLIHVFGHKLEDLQKAAGRRGLHMESRVREEFCRINTWDNNDRYDPKLRSMADANVLLHAAEVVIRWAQRIGGKGDA